MLTEHCILHIHLTWLPANVWTTTMHFAAGVTAGPFLTRGLHLLVIASDVSDYVSSYIWHMHLPLPLLLSLCIWKQFDHTASDWSWLAQEMTWQYMCTFVQNSIAFVRADGWSADSDRARSKRLETDWLTRARDSRCAETSKTRPPS
jgi:hypothetical protein